MGYNIEGRLLEACSCNAPCPCWIGDDPDGGTCNGLLAYHYDKGEINGVDVAGLTLTMVGNIPGNVLQGNWKMVFYVDREATPEQKEVIVGAHTGRFGGPLADLAPLIGEPLGVYDVPTEFTIVEGKGTIRVGDASVAKMEPYTDAQGRPTKLVDSMFSTIPGAPAYVGKASAFKTDIPQHAFSWEYSGRNAVLGSFRFEA